MITQANQYLIKGWSVIPLEPRGKKPVIPWKEFQDRKPTQEELSLWFLLSNNNLGIVTGKISGITVIDCDTKEGLELAMTKGLPTCPTVKTGKGYHFYYAYEPGVGNFQKRADLPGIDLRSDGGFVVAPPSIHESGKIYEWEGFDRPLPKLPLWVINENPANRQPIKNLYKGVKSGNRNQTLARLAGVWVITLSLPEAREMAYAWDSLNDPPMGKREVDTTVESIFKAELRKKHAISQPEEQSESIEIYTIDMLSEKIDLLHQNGVQPGISPGWESLRQHFTIKKKEWTVITGLPAHGKSTWLDAMMVNMATRERWKFGIFSAENLPLERHAVSLMEKFIGKPFSCGPHARMTEFELGAGKEFLRENFFFILPDEKQQNIDNVMKLGHDLVKERGIDCLVIDPWNELDQVRQAGVTETEHISMCLSKLRRMARILDIHIFVVAHPTKLYRDKDGKYPIPTPYDIHGSAHWRNKADNCITVWRDVGAETSETEIHIQKIRFREVGKVGRVILFYDRVTGRYFDREYENQVKQGQFRQGG